jgi:hypothetical protein
MMRKRELSQAAMANVLVDFVHTHAADIKLSKVAAKEAQDVVDAYHLIAPKLGGAARVTEEVTKRRVRLKATFLEVLMAVLGPGRSLATATTDHDMLSLVTVSKETLRKLRPQALIGVGKKLIETIEASAPALEDHGVDAATLAAVRTAYDAYKASVPQTRELINARSVDNMTAQELLKALMQQIYELDASMEIFNFRNKPLFAAYKQAREIVDVGVRPKDGGEAPA